MEKDFFAPQGQVMLLACSGGSNVGQLANRAAVELAAEGFGNMSCLVGIGGELPGFLQKAKDAEAMVVVDGCEIGCGKAIFDKAGIDLRGYLVLTEIGIVKNKDFNLNQADVDKVKAAMREVAA